MYIKEFSRTMGRHCQVVLSLGFEVKGFGLEPHLGLEHFLR